MKEQPEYLSYLLRLWRVSGQGESQSPLPKATWRASLEDPHTGERQGFASLDALVEFLWEQIGSDPDCAATGSDLPTNHTGFESK
jgi:hypothetical protein